MYTPDSQNPRLLRNFHFLTEEQLLWNPNLSCFDALLGAAPIFKVIAADFALLRSPAQSKVSVCAQHGHSPTAMHCSGSQPGVFIWPKMEKSIFYLIQIGKIYFSWAQIRKVLDRYFWWRFRITCTCQTSNHLFFLGAGYFGLMKMRFSNKNDNSYIPFSVFYFLTLFLLITSFSRKK